MDDFRKYATKHLGMNSLVLDDVIKSQAGYLNPYILEERQLNVTQLDVFSRLMMDRIIFLGTQVHNFIEIKGGIIPNHNALCLPIFPCKDIHFVFFRGIYFCFVSIKGVMLESALFLNPL